MRDGKSSEAISFVNSGMGTRTSYQAHEEAPAVSEPHAVPAAPAMPDTSGVSGLAPAKPAWSASFAEPPASAFAAVRADALDGQRVDQSDDAEAGRSGYEPAPKPIEVP